MPQRPIRILTGYFFIVMTDKLSIESDLRSISNDSLNRNMLKCTTPRYKHDSGVIHSS